MKTTADINHDTKKVIHRIDWSLYAIIDGKFLKKSLGEIAEELVSGGAGIIQYRNKEADSRTLYEDAKVLEKYLHEHSVPLIINDRIDIAIAVNADGVHLGERDIPVDTARRILGGNKLIGASVSTLRELWKADWADYLGVGAVFPTRTYDSYNIIGLPGFRRIRERTTLPIVGIGGIGLDNASSVIREGADGVAVISEILSSDNIERTAKNLVESIHQARSTI